MMSLKTIGKTMIAWLVKAAKQRNVRRGFAGGIFFLLFTLIISLSFMPQQVDLKLGEVSKEDVYAPKDLTFEDTWRTEEKRQQAATAVDKQAAYEINDQTSSAICQDIATLLDSIRAIQQKENMDAGEKEDRIKSLLPFALSRSDLSVLATTEDDSLSRLEQELNKSITVTMERGITQEDLEQSKVEISAVIENMGLDKAYVNVGQGLVNYYVQPNMVFYEARYKDLQKAARDSVEPVMIQIRQGEKIIGIGEVATEEHMKKLEALGLTKSLASWQGVLGSALLVAVMMILILLYIYQQNQEIYQHAGYLYLLGLVVLFVMVIAKGILSINFTMWPQLTTMTGYLVPLSAAGMLIAILLDSRLAILVVAVLSFLLAFTSGNRLEFGLVGFVGGFAGIFSVSQLKQKRDLVRAGIYTGIATIMIILIMGVIAGISLPLIVVSALLLGISNGFISSVLTIGALPYLESTFSITSSVKLLELSQPSSPLLKRLMTEAPGTYHHSILVANLAEAATEEVGGASLLARVGAYYHDIGKMKRPYFFIENQITSDNPHDKIAPSLSTLILISHVKDGLELAREYDLPPIIQDIIAQHHGVSLVGFFYHKAVEANGVEHVNEDEFRYEGPKPQTKEAAIVMLADTVEAAVRSLQTRNHGRIESMVRKLIREKLLDGQLDECDLTLKDLDTITNSFLKILSGMFHARTEYPEIATEMERRKLRDASSRKQLTEKSTS